VAIIKDDDKNGFRSMGDTLLASNLLGFYSGWLTVAFDQPLIIKKDETVTVFVLTSIAVDAELYRSFGIYIESADVTNGIISKSTLGESLTKSYIGGVPDHIILDGAFADWENIDIVQDNSGESIKLSTDFSKFSITNDTESVYFYFEVADKLMEGTRVPADPSYYSLRPAEIQDSDYDGVPDFFDPNPQYAYDSDGDGLADDYEIVISGTNATLPDTDGDGWMDADDIAPLDPDIPRTIPQQLPTKLKNGKDTANIFIDTDRNLLTGFRVNTPSNPMGADYMIEITGKHGFILSKELYEYDGSMYDWTWQLKRDIPVEKDRSRLEAQLEFDEIGILSSSGMDVYFWINDWSKKNGDEADNALNYKPGQSLIPKGPSRDRATRATTSNQYPTSISNEDGDALSVTDVDEAANGDSVYAFTGKDSA
jgi:hypothetical protein